MTSDFSTQQPTVLTRAVTRVGRKMEADPYQVGKGKNATWSMRRRVAGYEVFLSGFMSKAAIRAAMKLAVDELRNGNVPEGAGAHKTCVAQALQDYGLARLPFLKGAPQEARRMNVYLRAAGLELLKLTPTGRNAREMVASKKGKGAHFLVELEAPTPERSIPNGLHHHRRTLASKNAKTDKLRAVLATTAVADVSRAQMQQLMDRMTMDEHSASTVALERALLRSLFYYAHTTWKWPELRDNPATGLKMPTIDNERERVLSLNEQALLDESLEACRNELVAPTLTLLRETAMRASEPLEHATWAEVDWGGCVLHLSDAKAGKRKVPLSPEAIEALRQLQTLGRCEPHDPIVRVSYEALRAAWRRACERAGIEDLNIHDLRHTAATRMALKTGNVFLVKALTGHKTLKMLARYVNVGAHDVVEVLHAAPQQAADASSHSGAFSTQGVAEGGQAAVDGPQGNRLQAPSQRQVLVAGNVYHARFARAA